MAKQEIYINNCESGHSGISIRYTKSRKVLFISGWYDTFVGIEGEEISLADFLTRLGITAKDCVNALANKKL